MFSSNLFNISKFTSLIVIDAFISFIKENLNFGIKL